MPLSWNEIKHRANKSGNDWKTETRESTERQTFWNESFDISGIKRRTVASFEEPVKKLSVIWGFMDLSWSQHHKVPDKEHRQMASCQSITAR